MGKVTITIDSSQDLTLVNAAGKITCQEIKDAISNYSTQQQTTKVLWDFVQADAQSLTTEELRSIHHHAFSVFGDDSNRKIAVVVSVPVGFGLSRMSEAYGKMANPGNHYRTFYKVQDALKWLGLNQASHDGRSADTESRSAKGLGDTQRSLL
jgi:hypothetical protein